MRCEEHRKKTEGYAECRKMQFAGYHAARTAGHNERGNKADESRTDLYQHDAGVDTAGVAGSDKAAWQ